MLRYDGGLEAHTYSRAAPKCPGLPVLLVLGCGWKGVMVSLRRHFVPNPVQVNYCNRRRRKRRRPLSIHTWYDQNGNRTNNGYETGADNELLSDGAYTYQYDKDGNRIERTEIPSQSANEPAYAYFTFYSYDYENRLTDVIFENSAGTKTEEIQYTYDYAGRLIRTATDAWGTGVFTYDYDVYDGQNVYLDVYDSAGLAKSPSSAMVSQRDLYGAGDQSDPGHGRL